MNKQELVEAVSKALDTSKAGGEESGKRSVMWYYQRSKER